MHSPPARSRKKVLLLTIQPPGGSGVQSLIFSKLCPYLLDSEWDFHFAGPDPQLTSVLSSPSDYPTENLHYTRSISRSRVFSILKNRQAEKSPRRILYSGFQLFFKIVEQLSRHDSMAYLKRGIREAAEQAESAIDFDVIAGKSPDFNVLEIAAELAQAYHKPLLAIFDDPHGQRDHDHFYPDDRSRQAKVLDQAQTVLFMSPKTRERYVQCGLVTAAKCLTITDSYSPDPDLYRQSDPDQQHSRANAEIQIAHLGNLPHWRPIDTLLEALRLWVARADSSNLVLHQYGYLDDRARDQIRRESALTNLIRLHPAISYQQSHHAAARSDVLLVVIGARHLDNQPSKFFDYLGHNKPMLVLGPPGNPIQEITNHLGIGVFCDVRNPKSILAGIDRLTTGLPEFKASYQQHKRDIEAYSANAVANKWVRVLNGVIDSPANP